MIVLSIARTALKRLFRDRSNYFFVFVLPLALVLLIGAQFGGGFTPVIGVANVGDDELATSMVSLLGDDYDVRSYDGESEAVLAVERGEVSAAVVFPDGLTDLAVAGEFPEIGFVTQPDSSGAATQAAVEGALNRAQLSGAASVAVAANTNVAYAEARAIVDAVQPNVPKVAVNTSFTGDSEFGGLGQFDLGASSQLVLFVFLTGLAGSAALIQSRQLGVTRRMLSTPAPTSVIIAGEVMGRWAVAAFQGIYILVVTLVAFSVNWGDPLGSLAVIAVFALVGASAAVLFGAIFRNDQQAGGIAVVAGLGLAALGGSMVPVEIFSPTMRRVSMFTPHYWANDAFAELVRRDGTLIDVLPQLGILLAFTAVLLTLAIWRLRTVITR